MPDGKSLGILVNQLACERFAACLLPVAWLSVSPGVVRYYPLTWVESRNPVGLDLLDCPMLA